MLRALQANKHGTSITINVIETYLAERELLEEGLRLVGLSEDEGRVDSDLGPAVLSSDEGLEGTEVLRVGVEGLRRSGTEVGAGPGDLTVASSLPKHVSYCRFFFV